VASLSLTSGGDEGAVQLQSSLTEEALDSEDVTSQPLTALETLSNLASLSGQESLSDKEIKKIAFALCQERYELVLEVAIQLVELESSLSEEQSSGRGDRRGKKSSSGGKSDKKR
jgi:hypothetical protein